MTIAEFEKVAKENKIFYCTQEIWEQLKEDFCDNYCGKTWQYRDEPLEEICEKCPFIKAERSYQNVDI